MTYNYYISNYHNNNNDAVSRDRASIYINFTRAITKYADIYTRFHGLSPREPRKLSQTMIQVYTIYEHGRQRNPKNEKRNYENTLISLRDLIDRSKSLSVECNLEYSFAPLSSRASRYCPMMDYSVTSADPFSFFFPSLLFLSFLRVFFFFILQQNSPLADPVSYSIIMAVLAHVRVAWPPCSLKQWDVTLFSDVPSFRAGEHMRNLIHILAGMKFTTLITPRSAVHTHAHTRTNTLAHAAGVPMFSNFHPASVRQTGTISSI